MKTFTRGQAMFGFQRPAFHQRRLELEADYDEAIDSILVEKIIPLDGDLRYLLAASRTGSTSGPR
jgi:hypothetical protein